MSRLTRSVTADMRLTLRDLSEAGTPRERITVERIGRTLASFRDNTARLSKEQATQLNGVVSAAQRQHPRR